MKNRLLFTTSLIFTILYFLVSIINIYLIITDTKTVIDSTLMFESIFLFCSFIIILIGTILTKQEKPSGKIFLIIGSILSIPLGLILLAIIIFSKKESKKENITEQQKTLEISLKKVLVILLISLPIFCFLLSIYTSSLYLGPEMAGLAFLFVFPLTAGTTIILSLILTVLIYFYLRNKFSIILAFIMPIFVILINLIFILSTYHYRGLELSIFEQTYLLFIVVVLLSGIVLSLVKNKDLKLRSIVLICIAIVMPILLTTSVGVISGEKMIEEHSSTKITELNPNNLKNNNTLVLTPNNTNNYSKTISQTK